MDIDRDAPVQARAELLIDASPEQAWGLLTNIAEWSRWNPGVNRVKVHGALEPGTRFDWRSGRLPIASKIEVVESERRIVWTGKMLGINAVHVWEFEPQGDGVMVRTSESFDGTLARWFKGQLQRMLDRTLTESLRLLASECKRRGRERAAH